MEFRSKNWGKGVMDVRVADSSFLYPPGAPQLLLDISIETMTTMTGQ
jgi:hypothetical protein